MIFMLKILLIPNTDRFLEKVNSCSGDVVLHLPDQSTCSLKNDRIAAQMLRMMDVNKNGLTLSLTNPSDYSIMLNYMVGAA